MDQQIISLQNPKLNNSFLKVTSKGNKFQLKRHVTSNKIALQLIQDFIGDVNRHASGEITLLAVNLKEESSFTKEPYYESSLIHISLLLQTFLGFP